MDCIDKIIIIGKPITTNTSYLRGRGKRIYLSQDARIYKKRIKLSAREQYKKSVSVFEFEISLFYFFPDKRRDHLNCNKILLDALSGIVWKDDKQIKISHHYTNYDKQNPRIEVIINKKEFRLI